MDSLRWEEEGMKPEGTRVEETGLAMPCHYSCMPVSTSGTHRILRSRGIVSSSSNTGILGLRPLRRSRIWALTVRVDIIVRIAGHWEGREAQTAGLIYRID